MTKKIIHLDLDAFYCAVEELHNPSLQGKAFAVGGRPGERGVVSSCSYPARKTGVHSAMPMALAMRTCPGLIVVSPQPNLYSIASSQVMELLENFTARIEQISIDEAFLDLSDIPESGETLARQMQSVIQKELHLPCSLGVATNKLVAKIATDVGKKAARGSSPPNAITIVPAGQEAAFLAGLPAEMLWGIGPKTSSRLAELGIHTIGDIASWPEEELAARFGENGREMFNHANGKDERPVETGHEIKSISQEVTFISDISEDKKLERTVISLATQVGRRLRKSGLACTIVKIKLRWPDFTTLTRQITLFQPTDQDQEITDTALALFEKTRPAGKTVRLIGVGVSGLRQPHYQLSLWDAEDEKSRRLQKVFDELRDKYGEKAIRRGGQDSSHRVEHGWLHPNESQEDKPERKKHAQ